MHQRIGLSVYFECRAQHLIHLLVDTAVGRIAGRTVNAKRKRRAWICAAVDNTYLTPETTKLYFWSYAVYSCNKYTLYLCLSVTSPCSTKTTKHRITQTAPHDSAVEHSTYKCWQLKQNVCQFNRPRPTSWRLLPTSWRPEKAHVLSVNQISSYSSNQRGS